MQTYEPCTLHPKHGPAPALRCRAHLLRELRHAEGAVLLAAAGGQGRKADHEEVQPAAGRPGTAVRLVWVRSHKARATPQGPIRTHQATFQECRGHCHWCAPAPPKQPELCVGASRPDSEQHSASRQCLLAGCLLADPRNNPPPPMNKQGMDMGWSGKILTS